MTGTIPICMNCKHLRHRRGKGSYCKAFPEGIPDEIFVGAYDHRKPFPGDRGVRFEEVRNPQYNIWWLELMDDGVAPQAKALTERLEAGPATL